MAQTKPLVDTLKRALKAHARTYANVAKHLGLTEEIGRSFELPHSVFILKIVNTDLKD